jgi:crotonobetainyl-CoA:carnitine CoA-transferase CaiB-like acyl-CoA transferase
MAAESAGVLSGLRVLDFGRFVAGPYAATVLADLGANVVRIEPPDAGGDRFTMPLADGVEGANFVQLGRNKRSLTLDITAPDGRDVLRQLVRNADIVVVNVPAALLPSMGLDYETLRAIKPDIIMALATAYGSSGPYRDKPGFDAIGQCLSGAVQATGLPDQPVRAQAAYCDYGTALYLVVGILAALRHRDRTGRGQLVEASLLHTGIAFIGHFLLEQGVSGVPRPRTLNRSQTSAPADMYRTEDGWVIVFAMGDSQFRRIANLIGRPEWLDDTRLASDALRGQHGALVSEGMGAWCRTRSCAEVLAALEAIRVPCGPVLTAREVLADPQVEAMGIFQPTPFPGIDTPAPLITLPVRFSELQPAIRHRAPKLGEHSEAVLRENGISEAAIAELKAKGLV